MRVLWRLLNFILQNGRPPFCRKVKLLLKTCVKFCFYCAANRSTHSCSATHAWLAVFVPFLFLLRVVSGSRDATLRVWDIETGQCLHVLMGHVAAVRCVQYDGRRVVSGAYDFMVKVWDPETETCLHTLQGHTNRVYSLQVSSFRLTFTRVCVWVCWGFFGICTAAKLFQSFRDQCQQTLRLNVMLDLHSLRKRVQQNWISAAIDKSISMFVKSIS